MLRSQLEEAGSRPHTCVCSPCCSLYARQFPEPWQRLTQPPASLQQHGGAGGGVAPGTWRDMFLRTHTACQQARGLALSSARRLPHALAKGGEPQGLLEHTHVCRCSATPPPLQLRSTGPASREWTTDTTPVHLVSLHGSGARRLTLAAQGGTLEMRCTPSPGRLAPDRSIQCYGHSARVSAAAVLDLGGAVRRAGIVTASHDQTIRCVCVGGGCRGLGA